MEEGVRYHHKGGMATRENDEWVIDPLYREPITFPFRVNIDQKEVVNYPQDGLVRKRIKLYTHRTREGIKVPEKAVLKRMRFEEKMTATGIAQHYKVSPATVNKWLDKHGLVKKREKR